jgi:hypothetical protein
LDLLATLEAGRLLLLLLVLVPLGEIIPKCCWRRWARRWWWLWRRRTRRFWWRRTNAPLRALGLGAGLLGPASSPLALLGAGLLGPNGGGSKTNDSSARRSRRLLSSSDTPAPRGVEELLAAPLPLSKGRGPWWKRGKLRRGRWGPRRQSGGLQPAHRRSGSHDGGPDRCSGELQRHARRGSAA